MQESQYLLSTVDNPYSPWTEFDRWLSFDEQEGYFTNELLGRVCIATEDMSDELQEQLTLMAMQEIVKENVSGMHRLVPRAA